MKRHLIYLLFLISLLPFFNGCENSLEEAEFPFEFKLVIRGILEEGQPLSNIYVGRTMPIQDSIAPVYSYLSNASIAVLVGDKLYRLNHTRNGFYENQSVIIKPNTTYSLIASWEDKTATAITSVPLPGAIGSPEIKSTLKNGIRYYQLESSVATMGNEAYAAIWQMLNITGQSIVSEGTKTGEVARRPSTGETVIKLRTAEFVGLTSDNKSGMKVGSKVHLREAWHRERGIRSSAGA